MEELKSRQYVVFCLGKKSDLSCFFRAKTAEEYWFSYYIDHDALSYLITVFQTLNLNNHTAITPQEALSTQLEPILFYQLLLYLIVLTSIYKNR